MKNGTSTKGLRRASNGSRKAGPTLEASIMGMAKRGELAKPARLAIQRLRRKGIPITFRRGDKVIKRHANGREEVLDVIKRIDYKLPGGVRIIEGA